MAKATVVGLKRLRRPEDVARDRGLAIRDVLPVSVSASADAEPVTVSAAADAAPETTPQGQTPVVSPSAEQEDENAEVAE
jgi:hypothetical protein